ncbi:MAG: DUF4272 domain-containing protein [Deltaproteobacteria bacterium]|nr:DUF4272 domain-containing protein [Deltaproteobacteria bacterium]
MSEAPEYDPPAHTESEIVHRALCLAGLVERLSFELAWPKWDVETRKQSEPELEQLRAWLEAAPLGTSLSPKERKLLRRKPGSWNDADKLNISWRLECLGVLLWSVQLIDTIPEYDMQFEHRALTDPLPLRSSVEPLVARAKLRADAELDAAWMTAERWHGRARRVQGFFSAGLAPAQLAQMITRALGEPIQLGGMPYEALTFEQYSLARSIALERHHAFNWIFDGAPWDDVLTDT